MSKRYYSLMLFYLGLALLGGLLHAFLVLNIGDRALLFENYPAWFLTAAIVAFGTMLLQIKYYWVQRWRFVTVAATLGMLANLGNAIVFFAMLEFRRLSEFYVPSNWAMAGAALLLGICMLFTARKWLQLYGSLQLLASMLFLVMMGRSWLNGNVLSPSMAALFTRAYMGLVLISMAILMVHFRKERAAEPNEGERMLTGQLVGYATAVFALIFSILLLKEYFDAAYWDKKNFEKARALAQRFESHQYVNPRGETLHYKLLRPLNYDSSKRYPLVVSLPYGGQPADEPIKQIEGAAGADELSTATNRQKYPALIFIPHLPPNRGWGGFPQGIPIDTLVYETIEDLNNHFAIDTNKRYVIGISRGAYGAWHFICRRPDLFAAAIPICGGGNPALAQHAAGVAVWAFHGKHDNHVPVQASQNMVAALKQAGGQPKYTEYADGNHNIGYRVMTTPGLWDWLFAQQKQYLEGWRK